MAVLVLTGAASGIGAHMTGVFARRGDTVVATDVNLAALEKHAADHAWGTNVRLAKLDVREAADWDAALATAEREGGGLDVVMNIAGVLKPGWVTDLTAADVDFHLDVNVKGTVLGTRAAAARMVARGRGGHIVNIGSLASLAPVPGLSLYAASKFAVRGFTLAAAMELARHDIAVTLVMPDAVQTPMLDLQVDHEEAAMTFSGPRPLTVEDIEHALLHEVLPKRPLEIALPLGRGLMARAANTAPAASRWLEPILTKKGRKAQERIKQGR
ncbi:SDR family NAD(P)-dependent oxidoreductase [Polyangium sp. y55x31]|uniref:SDR family oxidoreductase n=1 Tax=Polyangium sp. y55x31 TaxID=3042688 RepID=UPI00248254DA|nr:SDR family NAD(P)-dependent oxidoreductase [Polyangium sp. y55x31]MDI1482221.1 SDR family NAD(P)-dependent oxidoreductase [Polyangium sp. y55x31]